MENPAADARRTGLTSVGTGVLALVCFLLILSLSSGGFCEPVFDCSGETYAQNSFEEPKRSFIPHERIYLMIDCRDLPPGAYTMHVNWVHRERGMVRTDSHDFRLGRRGDQKVFFWFKLLRRGPLTSAFTNQDFYQRHFGEWTVQGYLNDQPVCSNRFSISE